MSYNALAAIEQALLADENITEITAKNVNSGSYDFTVMTKSGFAETYKYAAATDHAQVYTGKIDNVDVFVPKGNGSNELISNAKKQSDCSAVTTTGAHANGKLSAAGASGWQVIATAVIAGNGFELETGYYKVTLTVDSTGVTNNTGLTFTSTINDAASPAYVKDTKTVTINLVTAGAKMGTTHKVQGKIETDVAGNAITVPANAGTPADYFAAESEIGTAKEITVTLTDNIGADTELTVTLTEATA